MDCCSQMRCGHSVLPDECPPNASHLGNGVKRALSSSNKKAHSVSFARNNQGPIRESDLPVNDSSYGPVLDGSHPLCFRFPGHTGLHCLGIDPSWRLRWRLRMEKPGILEGCYSMLCFQPKPLEHLGDKFYYFTCITWSSNNAPMFATVL